MPTGTVERFNSKRGFGFIRPEGAANGDEDANVFVHQNNIDMDGFRFLRVGEKVEYEEEEGEKGIKAVNVKLISPRSDRTHFNSFKRNPYEAAPQYDMQRLTKDMVWVKGALNRLIELLGNEGPDGEEPILGESEVEQIRHG